MESWKMKEPVGMPPKELSPVPSTTSGHPPCVIFHGTVDDTTTFATSREVYRINEKGGQWLPFSSFWGKGARFFIAVEGKMETKIITKHWLQQMNSWKAEMDWRKIVNQS